MKINQICEILSISRPTFYRCLAISGSESP
ncbi:MAG: helix-turn-helix domain-containing protein [Myxococcales bacterium]|nr:helix-turn-helix domain-containing protein [Myxococcales bacterium]